MARGMRSATYLSVLARAHLRAMAPLPKEELLALRSAVGQLGAIGRNLNQIAHAANSGRAAPMRPAELAAFIKVATALRDHFKSLLKANLVSWDCGHESASA
jgi:hypothetical protein